MITSMQNNIKSKFPPSSSLNSTKLIPKNYHGTNTLIKKKLMRKHKLNPMDQISKSNISLPVEELSNTKEIPQTNLEAIEINESNKEDRGKAIGKSLRPKRTIKRSNNFGDDFIYSYDTIKLPKKKHKPEKRHIKRATIGKFCVCKGIDDGIRPMIQCENCSDWFHFECVHIPKDKVPSHYQIGRAHV